MKIKHLQISFDNNGASASLWLDCVSARECDALMRWLDMAGDCMNEWERIRADPSRPAQAPLSEDENSQSREIQNPPPAEIRADRERPCKTASDVEA